MAARRKSWAEDPTQLKACFDRRKEARAHDLAEAKVNLSLFYSRPEWGDLESGVVDGDFRFFRALGFNMLQEAANAVRSEVCKGLEVKLVPVGGTFDSLRSAEIFNQLLNSRFESEKFIDLAATLFLDSELCGRGYGLWEPDINRDLRVRRLDPLNTFFSSDMTDVLCLRLLPRRLVMATWGTTDDAKAAIEAAETAINEVINKVDSQTDRDDEDNIEVYCGWMEPMGKLPGRQELQLAKGFRLDPKNDAWNMRLPVFSMQFDTGFRGGNDSRSLGRTIGPYSVWINALAKSYHEQLQGARTVVEHDDTIEIEAENANWQYWPKPKGAEVKIHALDTAVSQEQKGALTSLHDKALQEAGINSGMAAGEPPPAFKSGLAIQEWRKSLLSRLSQPQRQFETGWVDSMRIAAAYFPRLYKGRKAQLQAKNTEMIELIDFDSLNISEKEASWTFQVVSGLGLTDSGKLEVFGSFQEAGLITAEVVLDQMTSPDVVAVKEEVLAHRRLISFQISQARDHNKLVAPIDGQDYKTAASRASNAYAAAVVKGIYPRANLEKLRVLYHLFLARLNPPPAIEDTGVTAALPAQTDLAPAPAQAALGPVSPEALPPAAPVAVPAAA
jgi:hypothetical protein